VFLVEFLLVMLCYRLKMASIKFCSYSEGIFGLCYAYQAVMKDGFRVDFLARKAQFCMIPNLVLP